MAFRSNFKDSYIPPYYYYQLLLDIFLSPLISPSLLATFPVQLGKVCRSQERSINLNLFAAVFLTRSLFALTTSETFPRFARFIVARTDDKSGFISFRLLLYDAFSRIVRGGDVSTPTRLNRLS